TILLQPTDRTALIGGSITLQVTAVGASPLAYQWQFNGTNLPASLINTVAGNGTQSYSGDGGAALDASLANPSAVALDSAGNLYIADTWNNCIRRVSTNGTITTAAGNGTQGYSGDGGLAVNASLTGPTGVAVDAAGNLYIADSWNRCIRRVATNGLITTMAGNGIQGYSGDGGAATNASLWFPAGIAVDAADNLFVADPFVHVIRKITAQGLIRTVAGNGTQGYAGDGGQATNAVLNAPADVAVDSAGNLFIADTGNNLVRKVDTNGLISAVAGNGSYGYAGDGGAATNTGLANPTGIALGPTGTLFVADRYNNRVRSVDTNGLIRTVAGDGVQGYAGDGGAATNASLNQPLGVAVDHSGRLFIADNGNSRVREVILSALPILTLNKIAPTDAGDYQVTVTNPYGAVTSQVARVSVVLAPTIIRQPASQVAVPGQTLVLQVAAVGPTPLTYQWQFNGADISDTIITTVAGNGKRGFAGDGDAATGAALSNPSAVTTDPSGNLFIADMGNDRIRQVSLDGSIVTVAGGGTSLPGDGGAATAARLAFPSGVAVDTNGNLFIADTGNQRIRQVSPDGTITTVAGNGRASYVGDGGAATNASLQYPNGVAVDGSGNLFIADTGNHRIREVDAAGLIRTVAGNGRIGYSGDGGAATNASLSNPASVAVDGLGNLFIADGFNNRIRRVDTNGVISTVAGSGKPGYSGDGGAATNATLNSPQGIVVDPRGNLFVADSLNYRIRKIGTNGLLTTVAGNGHFGYGGDGGSATSAILTDPFGVGMDASGNLLIADTFNNRIRKVTAVGQPTLTIPGISAAETGNYRVIVSNAYGTVTSLVATVTMAMPPLGVSLAPGRAVLLQLSGSPGASYLLQVAANLEPPVQWQPLDTNAADANGNWSYLDTNTAAFPSRFYRLGQSP
ncbi:MAG: hypothetical protein KGS61_15500, partial [Verrucomicrobia bacterium]|nr:hypothetical protein [Verrucomicrobiota bacterium]